MDDDFWKELSANETDVDGAIGRLSGDRALYESILTEFSKDTTVKELESALKSRMWDDAFTAAHALKGLAGNLGLMPLFHSASLLVIRIRSGRISDLEASFATVRKNYDQIVEIIKKKEIGSIAGEKQHAGGSYRRKMYEKECQ